MLSIPDRQWPESRCAGQAATPRMQGLAKEPGMPDLLLSQHSFFNWGSRCSDGTTIRSSTPTAGHRHCEHGGNNRTRLPANPRGTVLVFSIISLGRDQQPPTTPRHRIGPLPTITASAGIVPAIQDTAPEPVLDDPASGNQYASTSGKPAVCGPACAGSPSAVHASDGRACPSTGPSPTPGAVHWGAAAVHWAGSGTATS